MENSSTSNSRLRGVAAFAHVAHVEEFLCDSKLNRDIFKLLFYLFTSTFRISYVCA